MSTRTKKIWDRMRYQNIFSLIFFIAGCVFLASAVYLCTLYTSLLSTENRIGLSGVIMGFVGVSGAYFASSYSVFISNKTEKYAIMRHKELISKIDKMESRILSAIKATKTKTARPQPARKATNPRKSGKKSK